MLIPQIFSRGTALVYIFSFTYLFCLTRYKLFGVVIFMLTLYPIDTCRMVNGLLKTALGPPSGSTTTLSPAQDVSFRLESVKCLVSIIKSMGTWMDQQLKLDDTYFLKTSENDASPENPLSGEETAAVDPELQSDGNSEFSDAATLEQRRAYKIELQV